MRRVYLLELLGLDDMAVKFIVLAIVLLLAETLIAERQKKKKGKTCSAGLLLGIRLVTVAAVALGWYMTVRGLPLMKADRLLAEGKYAEAIAAYDDLEAYDRSLRAQEAYANVALEAGDTELAARIYEDMGWREEARELLAEKAEEDLEQGDPEMAVSQMAELLCSPEGAGMLLENRELRDALFVPGRAVELELGGTWHIAAVEENKILVVQQYENRDFLKENVDVITWKDSALRKNLQFLRSFMLPLREAILLTRNENLTNDHGVIGPGEETQDYLFVMTPEEMERYLAPVAEHFDGVYYWTRTPVEGTVDDGCTAALLPDEHGGISVSLSTHPLILSQPVLAAMWVDTDLLLQGWSQFGK